MTLDLEGFLNEVRTQPEVVDQGLIDEVVALFASDDPKTEASALSVLKFEIYNTIVNKVRQAREKEMFGDQIELIQQDPIL